MTREAETVEKIEVAVEAEYRRRKPLAKSVPLDILHASHAALSVIREIVFEVANTRDVVALSPPLKSKLR